MDGITGWIVDGWNNRMDSGWMNNWMDSGWME